jgi:hypothetical protein
MLSNHDRFFTFRHAGPPCGGKKHLVRSETDSQEVERFDWIRGTAIQEAACLTFVRGSDIGLVAKAFGAVVERVRRLDFEEFCEEAFAHHEKHPVIGLQRIGDWVLVVEDNGFEGSRTEVLRRVSARSEAVSVFWNVNSLTHFNHAAGGEVRTSFEAQMPEYRDGTRPDALEQTRAGLPWCDADVVPLMLALSARITGQVLVPETFCGDFETYPVAPWLEDLPGLPESARDRLGDGYPPELIDAVRAADRQAQRRAATAVARRVLELADCVDHPVISRILASVVSRTGADPASSVGEADRVAISEAVRGWTWQVNRHRVTSKVRTQVRAAEVLRQATNADPLTAVFGALSAAERISSVDTGELAGVVSGALSNR